MNTLLNGMAQGRVKAINRPSGKPFFAGIRITIDIEHQSDLIADIDPVIMPFLESVKASSIGIDGSWDGQKLVFYPFVEGENRTDMMPEPVCTAVGMISHLTLSKKDNKCAINFRFTIADPPTESEDDGTSTELNLLAKRNKHHHIKNLIDA